MNKVTFDNTNSLITNQFTITASSNITKTRTDAIGKYGKCESAHLVTTELNSFILDGTGEWWDSTEAAKTIWSDIMADDNGEFASEVSVTIRAILWGAGGGFEGCTLIATEELPPSAVEMDATISGEAYSVTLTKQTTEQYADFGAAIVPDGNTVTFKIAKALPGHYAKLNIIAAGWFSVYAGANLLNATATFELDETALTLPGGSISCTVVDALEPEFKYRQKMQMWNDTELMGTFYLDESVKIATDRYRIKGIDAIQCLDDIPFEGAYFNGGTTCAQAITDYISTYYTIDGTSLISSYYLYGIVREGTARDLLRAIMMTASRNGIYIKTDGVENITFTTLGATATSIGAGNVYQGAELENDDTVTSVSVYGHSFTAGTSGEIKIGSTYYQDTKTSYSASVSNIPANAKSNIKTLSTEYIINTSIAQAVATYLASYYGNNREKLHASVVWNGYRLCDKVAVDFGWGEKTGNITKIIYTLGGTITKAEVIVR